MLPPESAFCSNHDRKRTFLGCVHAYFAKAFETLIQNADPNAVHGSTVHASLEKKTIRLPKKACLGILGMFNSGYCSSSSEPERRLYDVI